MKARGAASPRPPSLALSACGVAGAVEALRAGAADVVSKPLLPSAIEAALARVSAADAEGAASARHTPGIAAIGEHPTMRFVLDRVEQVADTDASVLVRGETGTGKEVIARLVHGASPRRDRPFVAVNVAAIPESLAEAELFGHVRGAFTGADRARAGRLAAAEGGTLFFDEIGDIPRSVQAKLLRVLQDREVVPVGGGAPVPIDVRVIAATQHDLEAMVADGRFRADLFYRLASFPSTMPPAARARRSDIPGLIEHFRCEVNAREGRRVPGFSRRGDAAAHRLRVAGQRPRAGKPRRAARGGRGYANGHPERPSRPSAHPRGRPRARRARLPRQRPRSAAFCCKRSRSD